MPKRTFSLSKMTYFGHILSVLDSSSKTDRFPSVSSHISEKVLGRNNCWTKLGYKVLVWFTMFLLENVSVPVCFVCMLSELDSSSHSKWECYPQLGDWLTDWLPAGRYAYFTTCETLVWWTAAQLISRRGKFRKYVHMLLKARHDTAWSCSGRKHKIPILAHLVWEVVEHFLQGSFEYNHKCFFSFFSLSVGKIKCFFEL